MTASRFLLFSLGLFLFGSLSSAAEPAAVENKAPAARPAQIDRNGALTLVRTALIALQQANQTNNYSVLYSMSAPGFQSTTPVDKLASNFAGLRNTKLDLSGVAVLEPQFVIAPQVDSKGVMRMAGYFPSTPMQVNFDLQYTAIENRWRLLGITVTVSPSLPLAPSSPSAAPAASEAPAKAKPAKPK